MTLLSRFRVSTLVVATLTPVLIALACTSVPGDSLPAGDSGNGGTSGCPSGQAQCAMSCVTISSDSQNCGDCGRQCLPGQSCVASTCQCTAPLEACSTGCTNVGSDPQNCGFCGTACPATAAFCSMGICSSACGAGLMACGQACVDVTTDVLNCGSCGTACPAGQSCAGSACTCPVGQIPCNGGCAVTCGGGGMGGTGAAGMSGSGAGGAGAGAGGSAGSGTAGAGGTPPVMKLCATKVTVESPTLTDFESYDGMVPAHGEGSWVFSIGPATAPAYAGLYPLSDNTGTYTLTLGAGYSSNFAAIADNTLASDWGGGIGMWMGCINASAYSGLTFWARGTTPTTMINVSLAMEDTTAPDAADPAGGGTCDPPPASGSCSGASASLAITADWTQYTIPWAMFTAGTGAGGVAVPATGDEITGLSFGASMNYVPNPADDGGTYIPEPGMFRLEVDNIGFAP